MVGSCADHRTTLFLDTCNKAAACCTVRNTRPSVLGAVSIGFESIVFSSYYGDQQPSNKVTSSLFFTFYFGTRYNGILMLREQSNR